MLNEGIGCSYSDFSTLYSSKADIEDKTLNITEDGLLQLHASTRVSSGRSFIRLSINNTMVYEGYAPTGSYKYLWSPLFPVRKGDVIKYSLTTETNDGVKIARIYKHRPL